MSLNNASSSQDKTGPKPEDLNIIANIMDTILNNMKSHIQNIQTKNKNSDNLSNNSDFQNLMHETQQGMISDLQKPIALEITKNDGQINVCKNHLSSIKRTEGNNQKKMHEKIAQKSINENLTKETVNLEKLKEEKTTNQQTLNKIAANANKYNIKTASTSTANSKSVSQKTPRRMQVVYPINKQFVSRSLSAMRKQLNAPEVKTVPNNQQSTRNIDNVIRNKPDNAKLRSHPLRNISSKPRSHSPHSNENALGQSYSKPISIYDSPHIPAKSDRHKLKNKALKKFTAPESVKSVHQESMEKNGQKTTLRPITQTEKINKLRNLFLTSQSNQNKKTTGTQIRQNKKISIKSTNRNNKPNQNNTKNEVKKVEIINNINFQNEKKAVDVKRKEIQAQIKTTSEIKTTAKELKNDENNKKQNDQNRPLSGKEMNDKEKHKEISNINEMGDSTSTPMLKSVKKENDGTEKVNANVKNSTEPSHDESNKKLSPPLSQLKIIPKIPPTPLINKPIARKAPSSAKHNKNDVKQSNMQLVQKQNITPPQKNIPKSASSKIGNKLSSKMSMQSRTVLGRLPYKRVEVPLTKIGSKITSKISVPSRSAIGKIPYKKGEIPLSAAELVQDYISLVNKAKKERKTFTVCGNYYSVRKAFIDRGWVEKMRLNTMDDRDIWRKLDALSNFELVEGIKDREHGDKYRRIFFSKLLAGHQVDFYWDYITNPFNINNDKIKRTVINRFPFGATKSYTSKIGLCESLKDAHWFCIEGFANIYSPRTYNLSLEEEVQSFIHDFRITAASSLLVWISKHSEKPAKIISPVGQIPMSVFNFACLQCYNTIKIFEHKDIDEVIPITKDYEWDIYLEKFYKIIHQNQHFKETDYISAVLIIDQSRYVLNKLRKYIPRVEQDGNMNLWLLKPNNGSRGCGIHICRTLRYVLDTISARKDTKYVIQKYIERPLLIHNTKFDIRQWFLVTCSPQLHLWLYKDCYLRFSTQLYDLNKLHESIHLTNNSIQSRYRNNTKRSSGLPEQNMWDSDTFRRYLSDIGHPFAWRNIIYKGIKECLIGLFMICQDKLITRINSFELCGADFMLTEDFCPHLIEINSRPALYASTRVTAKMCPRVLEDVIKVTVDYARNPKASTGSFELIYKDALTAIPPKNVQNLFVNGKGYTKVAVIKQEDPINTITLKECNTNPESSIQKILKLDPTKVRHDVKNTLEKILSIIHTEQNKADDTETADEKSAQFRSMLTEFVDIITTVQKKAEHRVTFQKKN